MAHKATKQASFINLARTCKGCDTSLSGGAKYLIQDKNEYCIECFESKFCFNCKACGKLIEATAKDISYKQDHFHEGCFCCYECSTLLVRQTFAYLPMEDGEDPRYVCSDCYTETYATHCDHCHLIIPPGSKKVEYQGGIFHDKCFTCKLCRDPIGRQPFVNRNNELYCQVCFENSIAERCYVCQQTISGDGIMYRGSPWHKRCFRCNGCKRDLTNQQFTSHNQQPYCTECYLETFAKICESCKKIINTLEGEKMITFDDKQWHMGCFNCWACNAKLGGSDKGFAVHEGHTYCPNCAVELEDDF